MLTQRQIDPLGFSIKLFSESLMTELAMVGGIRTVLLLVWLGSKQIREGMHEEEEKEEENKNQKLEDTVLEKATRNGHLPVTLITTYLCPSPSLPVMYMHCFCSKTFSWICTRNYLVAD